MGENSSWKGEGNLHRPASPLPRRSRRAGSVQETSKVVVLSNRRVLGAPVFRPAASRGFGWPWGLWAASLGRIAFPARTGHDFFGLDSPLGRRSSLISGSWNPRGVATEPRDFA